MKMGTIHLGSNFQFAMNYNVSNIEENIDKNAESIFFYDIKQLISTTIVKKN